MPAGPDPRPRSQPPSDGREGVVDGGPGAVAHTVEDVPHGLVDAALWVLGGNHLSWVSYRHHDGTGGGGVGDGAGG